MKTQTQNKFHAIIEHEVNRIEYGQITVNVVLKNGEPVLTTLHITRQKRRKYKPV